MYCAVGRGMERPGVLCLSLTVFRLWAETEPASLKTSLWTWGWRQDSFSCCVGWLPQRCWCKLMCGGRRIKESDRMMGLSKTISTLWAQHIPTGSFSYCGTWPVGAQLALAPRHEALHSLFNLSPGSCGQLGSNFWVVKAKIELISAAF